MTVHCGLPERGGGADADPDAPVYGWSVRITGDEHAPIIVCKNEHDENLPTTICMAPPLVLKLRSNIFSINKVDTVEQTFVADIFFECRLWSISEVDNQSHVEEMLAVYGLTKDMIVLLSTDIELEKWQAFGLSSDNQGKPTYSYVFKYRGKGEFAEEYELENFPFDEQFLNLSVSVLIATHLVRLDTNEQYPSTFVSSNFQMSNIFRVVYQDLVLTNRAYSNPRESASGVVYPRMTFSVLFLRKPMYYVTNIIIPMLLLTYLSFLSFSVGMDGSRLDTGDRLSITLTLLLTAVAYKFVVASAIPQVSYMTLLDQHISFCFAFLCVIIGENSLYPFLMTSSALAVAPEDEIYVFYALLGLLTLVTLVWLAHVLWWMAKRESYYTKKTMAEQVRRLVAQSFKNAADAQRYWLIKLMLQRNGIDVANEQELLNFMDCNAGGSSHCDMALPSVSNKSAKQATDEKVSDKELLCSDLDVVFASPSLLERLVTLLQRKLAELNAESNDQKAAESRSKRRK